MMYLFLAYLMTLPIAGIKCHLLLWHFMNDTEVICHGLFQGVVLAFAGDTEKYYIKSVDGLAHLQAGSNRDQYIEITVFFWYTSFVNVFCWAL
jgi:hypothetical protein